MLLRIRHLGRLLAELAHNAVVNRAPGMSLLVIALLVVAATIVVGQVVTPYIYTIF